NVKTIVFSSTAATYGDAETMTITEETLPNSTNAYRETKLTMENKMKWTEKAYGNSYESLRYCNVSGSGSASTIWENHHPATHPISIVLQVALSQREEISIFGDDYDTPDGTCIRDYVHVEDLIDAHLLALEYLQNDGASAIFNLGSSQGFSVKEIIETAKE